jgi:hypothetical protein
LLPSPVNRDFHSGGSSITNTFLKGLMASIDSKDPIVANTWCQYYKILSSSPTTEQKSYSVTRVHFSG